MTTTERGVLVLVLLAALAHAPGLAGGFVYDDHRFVENNDALVAATPTEMLLDPATHTAGDDRDVFTEYQRARRSGADVRARVPRAGPSARRRPRSGPLTS